MQISLIAGNSLQETISSEAPEMECAQRLGESRTLKRVEMGDIRKDEDIV